MNITGLFVNIAGKLVYPCQLKSIVQEIVRMQTRSKKNILNGKGIMQDIQLFISGCQRPMANRRNAKPVSLFQIRAQTFTGQTLVVNTIEIARIGNIFAGGVI